MRRPSYLSYIFVITLVLVLALAACTRPVPGSDDGAETETTPPTAETIIVPTTQPPTAVPAGGEPMTGEGTQEGVTEGDITEPSGEGNTEGSPQEGAPVENTPEPTPEPVVVAPTKPPTSGEERVHIVQSGENLFRISLNNGCDVNKVAAYNNITLYGDGYGNQWAGIYVGDVIKIPPNCQ